jgi:molybdenum cofactor cytidylyltransferase
MTPRVRIVLLAAGRSTRFGPPDRHKLLAAIGGVPLVRLSVSAAVDAAVGEVVVVTGARSREVEHALEGLPVHIVHEPAFGDGMAASLRRGVAASAGHADAIMIALGDQPGMRADAYRDVASRWNVTRSSIVVPRYADGPGPGHPTLFAAEVFAELAALQGDTGARSIITRDAARVSEAVLEWPAPRDVDTIEDLESLGYDVTFRFSAPPSATARSSPPSSSSP